jgi:hypothetical protein
LDCEVFQPNQYEQNATLKYYRKMAQKCYLASVPCVDCVAGSENGQDLSASVPTISPPKKKQNTACSPNRSKQSKAARITPFNCECALGIECVFLKSSMKLDGITIVECERCDNKMCSLCKTNLCLSCTQTARVSEQLQK